MGVNKRKDNNLCPACNGFGKHFSRPIKINDYIKSVHITCDLCEGTGQIDNRKWYWRALGYELKNIRLAKGISLRAAAKMLGVDASNLSKMERGVVEPRNLWHQLFFFGK